MHDTTRRLLTLRHEVLVVGAILGATGRTPVLRLGLRGRWRQRFAALLERIKTQNILTVAQLDFSKLQQQFGPPRPWKPRRLKLSRKALLPVPLGVY